MSKLFKMVSCVCLTLSAYACGETQKPSTISSSLPDESSHYSLNSSISEEWKKVRAAALKCAINTHHTRGGAAGCAIEMSNIQSAGYMIDKGWSIEDIRDSIAQKYEVIDEGVLFVLHEGRVGGDVIERFAREISVNFKKCSDVMGELPPSSQRKVASSLLDRYSERKNIKWYGYAEMTYAVCYDIFIQDAGDFEGYINSVLNMK